MDFTNKLQHCNAGLSVRLDCSLTSCSFKEYSHHEFEEFLRDRLIDFFGTTLQCRRIHKHVLTAL